MKLLARRQCESELDTLWNDKSDITSHQCKFRGGAVEAMLKPDADGFGSSMA